MGLLPLVAQEVGGDACENNAAAYQAFEWRRPEGHSDHEDAAQDETRRDEQRKLQKDRMTSLPETSLCNLQLSQRSVKELEKSTVELFSCALPFDSITVRSCRSTGT